MSENQMQSFGWQPHFEGQVTHDEMAELVIGRVTAHFGGQVVLVTTGGEIRVPVSLLETEDVQEREATGYYSSVAVGDWFLLTPDDYRAVRRLDRHSVLERKSAGATVKSQLIAANVDSVFIVSSCNQDFNLSRLERFLTLVLASGAMPVVVLTKKDLCDDPAALRRQAESLQPGLVVEVLDARDNRQVQSLHAWCGQGKTIALIGSSGVGKSTLTNTLGDHQIPTQPEREGDDKGRHTTTARALHRLSTGGLMIDTPGMRELQLANCEEAVADLFEDIFQLASECRFRDCTHHDNDGCAVEAAIDAGVLDRRRWKSFQKLESEQRRNSESLAKRRERERRTGQMYKRIIAGKRNDEMHNASRLRDTRYHTNCQIFLPFEAIS